MQALLGKPLGELLGVVVYGVVAGVLTLAGTLAELASVQNLLAGQSVIGAWELAMGGVLLYMGVNVARDFVVPSLRERGVE
jgi:hypothetical protein